MSLQSQLTRLARNVGALTADTNAIFEALRAKGVNVPANAQLSDVADMIESIVPKPSGLLYHTIFDNFDLDSGIDIPLVGNQQTWTITNRSNLSFMNVTIEGESKRVLKIYNGSTTPSISGSINLTNIPSIFNSSILSIEATIFKETYAGYWGFCSSFPAYNCYDGNRGIAFYESNSSNIISMYNGTRDLFSQGWYGADFYSRTDMTKKFTGGWTIDTVANRRKIYAQGKKMAILKSMVSDIDLECTNSYFYPVEIKIYNYDKFEECE